MSLIKLTADNIDSLYQLRLQRRLDEKASKQNKTITYEQLKNKLQQIEYASMQWEQLIAKNLQQGNVVSFGLSDDTRTIYAITAETQILAYFDSQVNVLHHAIDDVRSGEIPDV